jgi:predicted LPLAT superfamily acyltransferase
MNIVSADAVGPDTIIQLQDRIAEGGIVVIAGDRTAANTRGKYFTFPFLRENAAFAFGPFFLAALLEAPTYFIFALRQRDVSFSPDYDIHVHKSGVLFDCPRGEREKRVEELARNFAGRLENYCKQHPYQWYNFFDFWAEQEPGRKRNGYP